MENWILDPYELEFGKVYFAAKDSSTDEGYWVTPIYKLVPYGTEGSRDISPNEGILFIISDIDEETTALALNEEMAKKYVYKLTDFQIGLI